MKQYIFAIGKSDSAPAGGGEAKSWFFFYKWEEGEETYIPFPDNLFSEEELPEAGDLLWFFVEGRCVGYVPLLRMEHDPLNQRKELWYHTSSICRSMGPEFDSEPLVRFIVTGARDLATGQARTHDFPYLARLRKMIDELTSTPAHG